MKKKWKSIELNYCGKISPCRIKERLPGSIPPEIGNLTNLTALSLTGNDLTGFIPDNICSLNIDWSDQISFSISENNHCPPFPSFIEYYLRKQDTNNCDKTINIC